MKKTDIRPLLVKAEEHYTRGKWEEALSCFDTVLTAEPDNRYALEGRRKALAQRDAESQIVALIDEAQAASEAGRYEAAQMRLDHAQALGADRRILNHHAEIFALRDLAWEHQRWQNRIASDLKRARSLETRSAIREAVAVLENLLRDLTAAGIEGLGQAARQEWDRLRSEGDLQDRLDEIDRAFDEQNFRQACELAEQLARTTPGERQVERKCTAVCGAWQMFQRQLSQAEAAVAEGRLADARGILGNLRQQAPKNPDWQALWQRAYLGDGQRLVSAGQQAVQGHAFEEAQAAFTAAAAAFGEVLAIFPEHASAGLAQTEAGALGETARWLAQAVRDQAARRWDTAREALRGAREQLAAASDVRRQDFGDVKAVVTSLTGEVETAVEGLRRARALSSEGAAALAERAPDRAEKCYRAGLELAGERDAALQAELLAGLQEATRVQREVSALVELAGRSADAAEALGPLGQAHERWPDAPGLLGRLVETLLAAAEVALAGGDEDRAAGRSEQVLALAGVSEGARARAQAIAGGVGCKKQVAGALAEAQRLQGELDRTAQLTAEGYQRLVAVLTRAWEHAAGCPDQQPRVRSRLIEAQTRLERLQRAEPLFAEAEELRRKGEWAGAARTLGDAVGALGSQLTSQVVQDRLVSWGNVAAAIGRALAQVREALAQARAAYAEAQTGDLSVVRWRELYSALDRAEGTLLTTPADAEPLPAEWATLQQQVRDLRAKSGVLCKAWDDLQAGRTLLALTGLVAAAKQRPNDPILAAVREWLRKETTERSQAQAQWLLGEARALAAHGEPGEALERLAQARELDVQSAAVTAELAQLERQLRLLQRLNRNAVVGQTRRASNSPTEALSVFREVLQAAQDADSGLTDEVRTQLATLLMSEGRLHQEEVWARANGTVTALRQAGTENRILANHILPSVQAWFELATNKAQEGFISSLQALGQYMEAYATAKLAIQINPDNTRAITLAAENRVAVQGQLLGSAQKRLGRAKDLYEKGYLGDALTELDGIEDQFMQRVRVEHPELLHDFDALSSVLEEAGYLQKELLRLREREERLTSLASKARQLYASGTEAALREAEQFLDEAEWIDPRHMAKPIWADLDKLRGLIRTRLRQVMRERLENGITSIETELEMVTSMQSMQRLFQESSRLRADLESLSPEDIVPLVQRLSKMSSRAQERLTQFRKIVLEEAKARDLEASGNLEASLAAFEHTAAIAFGAEQDRLNAEIARVQDRLRRQRELKEVWAAALNALDAESFDAAQSYFADAIRLGISEQDVLPYKNVAEAGQLMRKALAAKGNDLLLARDLLRQILNLKTDISPVGVRLGADARQVLETIENDVQAMALGQMQRYLSRAGFKVRTIDAVSLFCTSDLPLWSGVNSLYVKLLLDSRLDVDESSLLRHQALKASGDGGCVRVALAILDHEPTHGDGSTIDALREHHGFTVVPLTRANVLQALDAGDESRSLSEQIGRAVGTEDLYDKVHPVFDDFGFFGRSQYLNELEHLLTQGEWVIVYGVRKIGKTSLLLRLEQRCQWPVAMVSLQGFPGDLAGALRKAFKGWRSSMQRLFPTSGLPPECDDAPDWTPTHRYQELHKTIIGLLEWLATQPAHLGLLLLLDETDALVDEPDFEPFAGILREISETSIYAQRFAVLCSCLEPRLNAVNKLRNGKRNPLFSFFREKPLGCLDPDATHEMIEVLGGRMGITYDDEALQTLVACAAGHPFLTRQVCSMVVRDLPRPGRVNFGRVRGAIDAYLDGPSAYLREELWEGQLLLGGYAQDILQALARNQPLPESVLLPPALSQGRRRTKERALESLYDRGLIRLTSGGWGMTIPLQRAWIRRKQLRLEDDLRLQGGPTNAE